MATRTISDAGGNWNAVGAWVEGATPVAGDDVVATATSGQLTINTTAACATVNFTGYTNTLTLSAAVTWTVTGNITLAAGMTITGTGVTLSLTGTHTLTANGKTWTAKLTYGSGISTVTLADDWTIGGLVSLSQTSTTNGSNLNCAGGLSTGSGVTLSGSTVIKLTGTGTWTPATAVMALSLTIDAGAGTITTSGASLTYKTGTLRYVSGTMAGTWGTTLVMTVNGDTSLDLATIPTPLFTMGVNATSTITLLSALAVTTFNMPGTVNVTFVGAFDVTFGTIQTTGAFGATRTLSLVAGQNYRITTSFGPVTNPTTSSRFAIVSGTPGTKAKLTLQPGATQDLAFVNFTDIDASLGQPIFSYKGAVTTSFNVYNTFPVVQTPPTGILGVS